MLPTESLWDGQPWTEGAQTESLLQILTWPYPSEYNVALFSLWYSLLPLSLDCDGINLCFPILFKVLLYAMCVVKVQIVYTALQYYHISPQYLQLVVDFHHFIFTDFFLRRLLSEASSKILLFFCTIFELFGYRLDSHWTKELVFVITISQV